MFESEPDAERVCVVISDDGFSEEDVRGRLGISLPLCVVRWRDRDYLSVVRRLRPKVIVVVAPTPELALDSASLVACLITQYAPTVVSLALPGPSSDDQQLVVQQLGTGASVPIPSLCSLRIP
jgi:hypothetical protein